jgi:hypothetical protein
VVWHLQQSFNKAREDLVARRTANDPNIAAGIEGNGDLELLLVETEDNLVAKVRGVSASEVIAGCSVEVTATSWDRKPQSKFQESGGHA